MRRAQGEGARRRMSVLGRNLARMTLSWKLVIDSTNAPALAEFWAAALGYEVEDPSALVEQLLASATSARRRSPSTVAAGPSAVTLRSATPRIRTTRPAASAAGGDCSSRTCPRARPARTVYTSTSTASRVASTSL
ncbi:VOC family protein [Kitasatospora cystarginea]|uniref:VOC family protein n=1 Tax=Kitasatospora cystarginea TaxID=58350 RepID=UPI003CD07A9F